MVLLANWKNVLWAWQAANGQVIDPLPAGTPVPLARGNPTFLFGGALHMLSRETAPVDRVVLRDLSTGRDAQTYEGHTAQILAVAARPEADRIITGSVDGTVRIWQMTTGVEVARLNHGTWITHVCLALNGRSCFYVDKDSVLYGSVP